MAAELREEEEGEGRVVPAVPPRQAGGGPLPSGRGAVRPMPPGLWALLQCLCSCVSACLVLLLSVCVVVGVTGEKLLGLSSPGCV